MDFDRRRQLSVGRYATSHSIVWTWKPVVRDAKSLITFPAGVHQRKQSQNIWKMSRRGSWRVNARPMRYPHFNNQTRQNVTEFLRRRWGNHTADNSRISRHLMLSQLYPWLLPRTPQYPLPRRNARAVTTVVIFHLIILTCRSLCLPYLPKSENPRVPKKIEVKIPMSHAAYRRSWYSGACSSSRAIVSLPDEVEVTQIRAHMNCYCR